MGERIAGAESAVVDVDGDDGPIPADSENSIKLDKYEAVTGAERIRETSDQKFHLIGQMCCLSKVSWTGRIKGVLAF